MAENARNILFEYLYRDASNWKQHGQAVFTNTAEIPLANIEARIRASLEGGEWFIAEMVDLETCFIGNHNTEDDHPWYESRGSRSRTFHRVIRLSAGLLGTSPSSFRR